MSLIDKTIGATKFINNHLMTNNLPFDQGGGFSSLLMPRVLNKRGVFGFLGVSTIASGIDTAVKMANESKMGSVSYSDGMARMTKSFVTGAKKVMNETAQGNYGIFSDMAQEVVRSPGVGRILDDYGADANLISSLYGMR